MINMMCLHYVQCREINFASQSEQQGEKAPQQAKLRYKDLSEMAKG